MPFFGVRGVSEMFGLFKSKKKEYDDSKWTREAVIERAEELGSYSKVFDEMDKDGITLYSTWGGFVQVIIGLGEETNERLKELKNVKS